MRDQSVGGSSARSDHEESIVMTHPHLQCAGSLEERVAQLEAWARRAEAEIGGFCEQLQRCMAMAVGGHSTEGTRRSPAFHVAPAGEQCDDRERVTPFDCSKRQQTIPFITFITDSRQAENAGISCTTSSFESGGSALPDAGIAFTSKMFESQHDETSMPYNGEARIQPEVGLNVLDPNMPAFVNVFDLSSSGLGGEPIAAATEHLLEASANVGPPPGLELEDGGRGKHRKRQDIIQCVKLKSSYQEYSAILEQGGEVPCEVPGTPDPTDTSISKRKWESLVSQWRAALRQVEKLRKWESLVSKLRRNRLWPNAKKPARK